MNRRQKRIFGAFLAALLLSQCVSVVVSFSAPADALRVWISPQLAMGRSAGFRAAVVADGDQGPRPGLRYRVVLIQGRREQPLLEAQVDEPYLQHEFVVPRWRAGPARLRVEASDGQQTQTVHVRLTLADRPAGGVRWVEPWRALAGDNPMDAADMEPPRAAKLPVVPFPVTGWAVRRMPLPLILRRRSDATLRVRAEGDGGVGYRFDEAGFAALSMEQPLHRGRYRVQVSGADGQWATHDLWLHNPPSELQLIPELKEVEPGQTILLTARADNARGHYELQRYEDGQFVGTTALNMVKGRGQLSLQAPDRPCWFSVTWASDWITDSRRRAFAVLRVGDPPWPAGIDDGLAHTGTALGRAALLSRIQPQRMQPQLRADTTALRRAEVREQKQQRQRLMSLVFQLIATAFVVWLCGNILAMHLSRKKSRKMLAFEMEDVEVAQGQELQTFAAIMVLAGLLCLLYVIGYLFNHMVWGW